MIQKLKAFILAVLAIALAPLKRYHDENLAFFVYSGATAASSLANPPLRIAGGLGGVNTVSTQTGGGRGVWLYNSSNGTTELTNANYFTDAYYLGMKQGDLVMGGSNTGSSGQCYLGILGPVTTNGANIGTSAGSTNGLITSTH